MRLIDADALLEQYNLKDATKYGNKDVEQQAHSYSTMMMYEIADIIEDAPTAYDPDNIVEQLETLRKECEDPLQDYCPDYFIDRAVDFVKGGGVNE